MVLVPQSALYPPAPPTLLALELGCRWRVGGSCSSSCHCRPRAEPAWGQSWVSEEQDGWGWQRVSRQWEWGRNEKASHPSCLLFLPGVGQLCGSVVRPERGLSRASAPEVLPASRRLPERVPGEAAPSHPRRSHPRASSRGSPGVSEHSADLKFPVAVEGQQLWVQGERKLTEGAAGPAEWPRASQRRSLPPGWHGALLWGSTAFSKVTPARSEPEGCVLLSENP